MNDVQKLMSTMTSDEIEHLSLRLGRYAAKKSLQYKWRTENSDELPKGETIKSIVSLAFELILSGKRVWKSETNPDFAKYLMNVIDSLLNHLAMSLDNRLLSAIPETIEIDNFEGASTINSTNERKENGVDWLARKPLTPEQILENSEESLLAEEAFKLLKEQIKGDEELMLIVEAIEKGNDTDQEIQDYTNLEITKVRNAKKRLARKVEITSKKFVAAHN
jgi:hypothetical protein